MCHDTAEQEKKGYSNKILLGVVEGTGLVGFNPLPLGQSLFPSYKLGEQWPGPGLFEKHWCALSTTFAITYIPLELLEGSISVV